ncbi:hypothetical protein ILP97_18095 [Amycolatopsis sp. H6(2020)]|nr:hypothetical protein [Amycolatopsis sp. H6(2020)]
MLNRDQLWTTLTDLLLGCGLDAGDLLPGAELLVFDGDAEVFSAALARHARRDEDDPNVIWIRPLHTGAAAFDLSIQRRRALHVRAARKDGPRLVLDLVTGQRAEIQPATGDRLAVLQGFDTWMTTLSFDERAEVEALAYD